MCRITQQHYWSIMPACWLLWQSIGGKVGEGGFCFLNDLPNEELIMLVYLEHLLPTLCFRNTIKCVFSRLLGLWPIGKPVDVTGWTHVIAEKSVFAEDKVGGLRLRRHLYGGGVATTIDQ